MKKDMPLLGALICISLLVTFYCQHRGFVNPYLIHDDVNQYLPAVYALSPGPLHNALLDGDLIIKYMVLKDSPGHLYLLSLLSRFMPPLSLIRLLPFFLAALSTICFFYLGKAMQNSTVGFFCALIFSFYLWTSGFGFLSGAFPKAFAFPLLLLFLIFLSAGKRALSFSVIFLQVLIFPAVALVSLAVYFLNLFRDGLPGKKELFAFGFCALGFLLISTILYRAGSDFLGSLVSLKEMASMPEFGPGGRDYLFTANISDFFTSEDASGIAVSRAFWVLALFFLASSLYLERRFLRLPRLIVYVFFCGVVLFWCAWIFLFYLFFPGRYIEYTLPLFMITVIALAIDKFLEKRDVLARRLMLVGITAVVIFVHLPFLQQNLKDYQRPYYEYLKTLPQDALVAAHPYEADPLPTFAQRRVLVQFEVSTAWYRNYYSRVKERTYDFFRAYYASSWKTIEGFFRKYGISCMIVNKGHFEQRYLKEGKFYLAPFNEYVRGIVRDNQGNFVLAGKERRGRTLYEDRDFYILSLKE